MTYSSEKVYVRMEREIIRESFRFYASRSMSNSMIGNNSNGIIDLGNSIDAVVSEYVGAPIEYIGSTNAPRQITSRSAYGGNGSNNSTSTNSLPNTCSRPSLLEYKAHADNGKRGMLSNPNAGAYTSFNYNPLSYTMHTPKEYFAAENFLHLYRAETQFVDQALDVEEHVKEAFKATTGYEFGNRIQIVVCDEHKFRMMFEANGGQFKPGLQGFSVHRKGLVVVKQNKLDVVMLVIGHEIGHVMSAPLVNVHDEEAKAFAFEMEWMKAIKKHNIANLASNINIDFRPADNGLHNVAFNFVRNMVKAGKRAMDVFKGLVRGEVSMAHLLEEM